MKKLMLILLSVCYVSGMAQNTLTANEKKEGWKLLFDGKSLKGWRTFKTKVAGAAWNIQDGAIHLTNSEKEGYQVKGGGDLITDKEYENYELTLEWKIQACGNSGIIFNVVEADQYNETWRTGPEMQVLDNTCHPDAKIIRHRAGDLYDLISCSEETVKPAGEWNKVRLVNDHSKLTFYLNGEKVVSATMHSPEWDELVANSKFKDMPDFGKATKGHIALQDHGNEVWFRNIKIKDLGR